MAFVPFLVVSNFKQAILATREKGIFASHWKTRYEDITSLFSHGDLMLLPRSGPLIP
jgi:hypothetical protein